MITTKPGMLWAAATMVAAALLMPASARAQSASAQRPMAQAQAPRAGYQSAVGYIGVSLLQIPDVAGDWRGAPYRGWVRIEAHYWQGQVSNRPLGRAPTPIISVPGAPRSGEGALVISVRKDSPALPALMERCRTGATMPEARYSVSTDRYNRRGLQVQRPTEVPENFEYRLTNVQFVDCPVVDAAPEQAIVVRFSNIEWLNWSSEASSVPVTLEPAQLPPLPRNLTGQSRTWVINWIAPANFINTDQCPAMNVKPSEADYYALVPPAEAEAERAALASEGGVSFETGLFALRGPHRLNAVALPGIVADPMQAEPRAGTGRGLNLDGRTSGPGGRRNYTSEDGAITGIDNQLYTAMGCNLGWQGHNGFFYQYAMEQIRNGQLQVLLQIDGIDNERNDREVYVTVFYSHDPVAKSGDGRQTLPDYTFRPTDDPIYAHYAQRMRGRIVDGVVITDPIDAFRLNIGTWGGPLSPGSAITDARMRIELRPDRSLHAILGGYVDWRELITVLAVTFSEFNYGYQNPAVYNSLRRNADGLRDPLTGEYNGISAAYDWEGIPAFVASPSSSVASVERPQGGS